MKNINSIISGITTAVVCLVMSISVFGQNKVDLNLATRVGENFIKMNTNVKLSGREGSLQLVQTDKFPNLYIFNADGKGWIIVAGDKRMQPILGFSDEGTFDPNDMAPAAEMIIGSYNSQFKSNKPEIQSKRSKKSKRFKISKETEEENEDENKKEISQQLFLMTKVITIK